MSLLGRDFEEELMASILLAFTLEPGTDMAHSNNTPTSKPEAQPDEHLREIAVRINMLSYRSMIGLCHAFDKGPHIHIAPESLFEVAEILSKATL